MDAGRISVNLDDFPLDILGQQPRINRLYTQTTFCFPHLLGSSHAQSEIVNTLSQGLERLSANFPWIAGKVAQENGNFKIKPFESKPRLVVKDYGHFSASPNWESLCQANFPFHMLAESTVAPCRTLAVSDGTASELPLFLIQVNFITGGLLLTFNGQHGSMDMTGQGQIIHLFAKACRNVPFTPSELSFGNMNRKNIIPLLDDYPPELNQDSDTSKSGGDSRSQPTAPMSQQPPSCTWAYFMFSAASLANLKSLAMKTVSPDKFVSTDDVFSAYIWQAITLSRLPRFNTKPSAPTSTLSRNVDVRRHFSLPSSYPGLVTTATLHTHPIDALVEEPLGSLAGQLRSALDPESLKHTARTLATLISRNPNAPQATFVPKGTPELDVRLSSWAKEDFYSLDFGFGKPEAVRRPRFKEGAREGLVYFLPKTPDGDIAVGVCLRDEDLERLKGDEAFAKFGTYVG